VKPAGRASAREILETEDASLLDLVDNLLDRGVVITGDLVIGLAGIDLIAIRLAALVAAADRVQPTGGA
jgi:hypothetical protein